MPISKSTYRVRTGSAPFFTQAIRFALPLLFCAVCALGQDPGSKVGLTLQSMFTGPLMLGLTIAGIVFAGVLWIFGGHQIMQVLSRVLLGSLLVLDAVKIVTWIQGLL